MAYTNFTDDVYVFGDGESLRCSLGVELEKKLVDVPKFFVARGPDKTKSMLGHLIWLQDLGARITGQTIRRFLNDIDKETYDIEDLVNEEDDEGKSL